MPLPALNHDIPDDQSRRPIKLRSTTNLHEEEQQQDTKYPPTALMIPEILTNIFRFLDTRSKGRVAQVCLTWQDAAYRPCLWREVVAGWHPYDVIPTLVDSLLQRDIRRVRVYSPRGRAKFVMDMSDMSCINLSGWSCINNLGVCHMVDQIPELRSLSLLGQEVTDNLMHCLAKKVPTLLKLDLRYCLKITDFGILELAESKLQLESLTLYYAQLTNWSLRLLQLSMPSLKSLCLRGGSFTDSGVSRLALMPNLQELDLSYNREMISGDGLGCLLNASSKLVRLELSQCKFIDDDILRLLGAAPSLRMLNLSFNLGVTDRGLALLVEGGSKLEDLDISSCKKVKDAGLGHLTKLRCLCRLNISWCRRITEVGLLTLAGSEGAVLTVTGCEQIHAVVLPLLEGDQFRLISQVNVPKSHINRSDFKSGRSQIHPLFLKCDLGLLVNHSMTTIVIEVR